MEVRIGVTQAPREIEVEVGEDTDRDQLVAEIESSLGKGEGVLSLTDRRGRRFAIPVAKVAYVEVGTHADERRVGFGTH